MSRAKEKKKREIFISRKNCVICGSAKLKNGFSIGKREVIRCGKCSMMFASTYSEIDLQEFYISNYYYSKERIKFWIKKHENVWKEIAAQIIRFKDKVNSLLDIGAGSGGFIKVFLKFSPETKISIIESSRNALDYIKTNFDNVWAFGGAAEDITEIKKSYDVITVLQVLEHLDDPLKICKEIYNKLNSNGVLFLTVPNRNSYEAFTKGKERTHCYSNPTHLNYFNKKNIEILLLNSGFKKFIRLSDYPAFDTSNILAKYIKLLLRKLCFSTELRYIAFK